MFIAGVFVELPTAALGVCAQHLLPFSSDQWKLSSSYPSRL